MSLRPSSLLRPALAAAALCACLPFAGDLLPAPALIAQAPAAKPAEPGWVQLFNGKDLTGWVKVGQEQWTVEDGAIYGVGVTKEYGYLRTEQKYVDFDLTLRFKVEADGNSGVFFHSDFPPGSVDISQGLQFEIDRVLNHHTGGLYGDGRQWVVWPAPELETVIRPDRLERDADARRRPPLHVVAERHADGRLHRPDAEVVRRLHLAAAPLRRPRPDAVPRHLHPRPHPALIAVSTTTLIAVLGRLRVVHQPLRSGSPTTPESSMVLRQA